MKKKLEVTSKYAVPVNSTKEHAGVLLISLQNYSMLDPKKSIEQLEKYHDLYQQSKTFESAMQKFMDAAKQGFTTAWAICKAEEIDVDMDWIRNIESQMNAESAWFTLAIEKITSLIAQVPEIENEELQAKLKSDVKVVQQNLQKTDTIKKEWGNVVKFFTELSEGEIQNPEWKTKIEYYPNCANFCTMEQTCESTKYLLDAELQKTYLALQYKHLKKITTDEIKPVFDKFYMGEILKRNPQEGVVQNMALLIATKAEPFLMYWTTKIADNVTPYKKCFHQYCLNTVKSEFANTCKGVLHEDQIGQVWDLSIQKLKELYVLDFQSVIQAVLYNPEQEMLKNPQKDGVSEEEEPYQQLIKIIPGISKALLEKV